jgi:hypothetical protein
MAIKKATRERVRLSALLEGLSGSGKTLTAFIIANAIVKKYGGRIGVIDSQGGQSLAYADAPLPNGDTNEFDIIELADGHPNGYVAAINEFEATKDHRVIIVDSLTHAWTGKNGLLELKDKAEGKGPQPWAQVTPIMNRLIDKIITCQAHLVATVRVKSETIWEKNAEGKTEGHKVGLKAVQKEGLEYEFQVYGSLDEANTLRVHNARGIQALHGAVLHKPDGDLTRPILEWLETGKSADDAPKVRIATPQMVRELKDLVLAKFGTSHTVQEQKFWEKFGFEMTKAPYDQIAESLEKARRAAGPAK